MYDELVKRLWECASGECFNCSQYTETTNASVCQKELMKQAADAIEKLSVYVRQIEELRKDGYYLQKTEMMTYGQATMTQPLPQPPKEGMSMAFVSHPDKRWDFGYFCPNCGADMREEQDGR